MQQQQELSLDIVLPAEAQVPSPPSRIGFGGPPRGLGSGLPQRDLGSSIRALSPLPPLPSCFDFGEAAREVKSSAETKPPRKRVRGPGKRSLEPKPGHYFFYFQGVAYEIPVECLIVPCSALYKN